MSTSPCPACGRVTSDQRPRCLYCGAALPTVAAAPAPRRAEPANLDALVRDAMRGGGLGPLRAALTATRAEAATEPAPTPAQTPAPTPPPSPTPAPSPTRPPARTTPEPRAAPPRPPTPPRVPPPPAPRDPSVAPPLPTPPRPPVLDADLPRTRAERLDALVVAAERARVALDLGAALDAVERAVADARALASPALAAPAAPAPAAPAAADPPAEPAPIPLPPVRFPWLLVVTAGGAPDRLAAALGIDVATARLVAQSAGPRVVGRGEDRAALEARAAHARGEGLHATVIARSALLELPAAEALLSLAPDGACVVSPAALWLEPPDPGHRPDGVAGVLGGVFLVVPGEVEVRDQRAAREPEKWARKRITVAGPVAERRVTVVDLHLPDRIVRVAEAIVDLRADPAHVPGSARRTLLAWLDTVPRRWPDARVEARRTCPGGPAAAGEDGRLSGSGWPAWEEYSRTARLHGAPA